MLAEYGRRIQRRAACPRRIIPAREAPPRSLSVPRIRHPSLADPEAVLRSHLPRNRTVELDRELLRLERHPRARGPCRLLILRAIEFIVDVFRQPIDEFDRLRPKPAEGAEYEAKHVC